MGIKKRLSILLCSTLMLSLALGTITPAFAKSTREAIVESLVGVVKVTKAGGSKSYSAFKGMALNQGDHIETGAGSKVVLRIVDHDDEVTIDEKSSMYISELSENTKGKKSKVKMWAGSLWGKVKTLTGTDDEFTVETPTAVMGVRGTTLLVGVDPTTGESSFYIASGQGQVSSNNNQGQSASATLNPNEQMSLDEDTDANDYDDNTSIADLDNLISNTSNAIIEAIIASKAAIDQENADYIAKLEAGEEVNSEENQATIDRLNKNLNNLVGNIVKSAISLNKVKEAEIKAFIELINEQLDKKLDLDKVVDQELTEAEKAKQDAVKKLEEERKQKQEAEKLKQDELKKQNEELQKKLKDQLEKQKAEKEKADEAAKKKAAEEHAKNLSDADKAAFEKRQKEIADDQAKQKKAAADASGAAAAAAKAAAEAAAKAAAAKAAADAAAAAAAEAAAAEAAKPRVLMEIDQDGAGEPATVNVYLKNFGLKDVYAAQLHFTHKYEIQAEDSESFESDIFTEADPEFVSLLRTSYYMVDANYMAETMFVVTKHDNVDIDLTNDKTLLVSIGFDAYMNGDITLSKVIIVDHTGAKHTIIIENTKVDILTNREPN